MTPSAARLHAPAPDAVSIEQIAHQAWAIAESIVARVVAVTPPPNLLQLGLPAAVVVAIVALPRSWRVARHGITIVHEAGHGVAATLTGRRLAGIRLHSDTSGVTLSVGRRRGPGMIATLLAGYPAPSIAGALMAWAIGSGHAAAALWGALLVLLLVLVQIRNWFGLWSVAVAGALVGAATWLLDPAWRTVTAVAVCALLLAGGLRAALELPAARRRDRARRSDADQLAGVTVLPAVVWLAVFILIAAAAVGAAAWLVGVRT